MLCRTTIAAPRGANGGVSTLTVGGGLILEPLLEHSRFQQPAPTPKLTVLPVLTCLLTWVLFLLVAGPAIAEPTADQSGPHLVIRGDLIQGGLVRGEVAAGTLLTLNGREVPVTPDGLFVLGFGRDEVPRQHLVLTSPQGEVHRVEWTLEQRKYDIQKVTGIPRRIMEPSAEDLQRINEEIALTTAARKRLSDLRDFAGTFIWPAVGPLTGVYGSQRVYNGEAGRPHFGLDIAAPRGAPVVAPAGGRVSLAHHDMFYSGGTVILDHGMGLSSTFIHLDAVLVEPEQRLQQGELLGRVGASGRATGPHLDWRMNWFDVRLDPQILMRGIPMPPAVPSTQE